MAGLLASCCTEPKSESLQNLITYCVPKSDGIYLIGGRAIGASGGKGTFYMISELLTDAPPHVQQFKELLKDPDPAVRAMGLVCLGKSGHGIEVLHGDHAEIEVLSHGCLSQLMTLEAFSKTLKENKHFRYSFGLSSADEYRMRRALSVAAKSIAEQDWNKEFDSIKQLEPQMSSQEDSTKDAK